MSQILGIDAEDLLTAHIGGMGTLARGREVVHAPLRDPPLETWRSARSARCACFDGSGDQAFSRSERSLQHLSTIALRSGEPHPRSGRQKHYEHLNQSLRRRAHTTTRLPEGEAA